MTWRTLGERNVRPRVPAAVEAYSPRRTLHRLEPPVAVRSRGMPTPVALLPCPVAPPPRSVATLGERNLRPRRKIRRLEPPVAVRGRGMSTLRSLTVAYLPQQVAPPPRPVTTLAMAARIAESAALPIARPSALRADPPLSVPALFCRTCSGAFRFAERVSTRAITCMGDGTCDCGLKEDYH